MDEWTSWEPKNEGSAGADQALEDGTFSADVLMWVSLPGDLAEPFRHFLRSTLPTAYPFTFSRDLVTEVCDVVCSPCDIFVWRQAAVERRRTHSSLVEREQPTPTMVKLSLALAALCATSAAAFAPQQGNQAFRCVLSSGT